MVVTRLDHDANIRPWVHAAEAVGATVRWAEFDPATGELTEDDVAAVLSPRTRLVARHRGVEPARHPARRSRAIADLAHAVGALVYVDGVHYTAHAPVTSSALGADFYACSPYKFLGPHCGVLAADPALLETLRPDKLLPSTDAVPERFELGTLPYELLAGTTAAVDFLAALGTAAGLAPRAAARRRWPRSRRTRTACAPRIEAGLAELPGRHRVLARRAPHPDAAARSTGGRGGGVRVPGRRAASTRRPARSTRSRPSRRLGLGDTGALRVGLAPYVDDDDVDRLLEALSAFAALNSGGRKRNISADHVRWVSSGAWIPPVLRR